jgi:hypothetical protein
MTKQVIWTAAARQLLFERLVAEFGPYSVWAGSGSPGRGLDKRYREFLEAFAIVTNANSADAVQHQIMFAVPVRGRAHWSGGHQRSAVMNLAAALSAGFIVQADLPDSLIAVGDDEVAHEGALT